MVLNIAIGIIVIGLGSLYYFTNNEIVQENKDIEMIELNKDKHNFENINDE